MSDKVRQVVNDGDCQIVISFKQRLSLLIVVASAAELSLPEIDHALVLLNDRAINNGENRNGKRFATQLWEVSVYPNREGILVVPSFAVSFTRAVHSNNQIGEQRIDVDIEQLLGLVSLPDVMEGLSGFMVSTDIEINDECEPLGQALNIDRLNH